MPSYLPFEKDIADLEVLLRNLEAENSADKAEELRRIQKEVVSLKKKKFAQLTAWQTVLVSRHPERPQFLDYVNLIFDDFTELHGDKAIGDDRSLRTGIARLDDLKVMLIGHHKGRNLHERQECFYGCAHPEGYRKALMRMKFAAKFGLPIVCLIDTPGAYPGIGAEERGQAQLIAMNLLEMSRIPTPIVCVVIGEGGSGGALGIGIGDRVSLLEYSYYSVISPEGCAGILWKHATEETKSKAAEALKLTARNLMELKVIDEIIPEPLGGAHRDQREMANTLKLYLLNTLRELKGKSNEELLEARYQKFRHMGVFVKHLENAT